jgi:hypothetical protein
MDVLVELEIDDGSIFLSADLLSELVEKEAGSLIFYRKIKKDLLILIEQSCLFFNFISDVVKRLIISTVHF